ncbi:7TM diverse intracellular signaling domain-containing protein [Paraglaciecola arctica]|uniref:7TM diverse intracellular signaling domain-containing protein n=1 Tax=Paraglaciecola arctica TaxID=1128911 RepID=UPI001C07ADE6|nr:7TM diverse intracellular signaling domain-containing protein [Paraglaciecola arctica]MBU3003439.1 response regulator [Paraglaciecola arctica]
MKQIKLLVCFIFFCLCLTANGTAAKKIVSFDLSKIINSDISEQVSYFSLKNNTNPAPSELPQLVDWLSTLPIHHTTNLLGDKYAVSFEIYNDTQQTEWFIYPYGSLVQHIEIRYYDDTQTAMSLHTGHGFDNQQDFHYGSSIEILPGQRKTLLLLFESEFFTSPIRILVKPQAEAEQLFQIENVILLLCLGICFALGIYNLFIFITTRDPKYLYYAIATSCYALGWACGFGVPEFLGIVHAEYWLVPTFLIGSFFSIFFNIRFLHLEKFSPKICKILKITAVASLISLPIAVYSPGISLYLAFIFSSVILITGVYSGINCWIKGYSPAKYFVFALLSVALPNIVGNLISLGILPGLNTNIYLLSLIGVSLDSLLLAFALAAQVRLLSIHNEELTATLENTVEKRTAELRHANIQLEQSNAELIEASNAKGRFLATMSHEIRTPLTSIIGYADGILHGDIDKSEQARVTKIIAENGNHLLSVINDILDISKIEANKLDFESIATPLFSVLAQIESIVGKRVRDKGLAFHLEYEFPLPTLINTDPTRLKQILFNLTNNAIKFTDQGYIGLSVRILDNRLQIQVKDSGEGISAQQQEQLFEAFTQADSSTNRRFGGTGLGLSIARRLANGLGGNIEVISAPRKGSTFILDINLDVVQDSPWINNVGEIWQSTTTKSVLATPLPNFVGNRVLLADDHPNNRELISILLKRMNITVTEVEDGKQVLETIFYQTFDLILLDIHMPQMDGTEALKQIRAAGNYTPVIALTANNMKHEIDHYMRLGFSDHLAKPISRDHFIRKLSLYLNKQGEIDGPIHQGDMLKLIKDYQLDLRDEMASLQKALEQGDLTIISEIAHRIRGSAGSFGFDIIGQKFADIEHCALQDDEIAVTYELPKVIALTLQCIDLPGVDIAQGIINHHNSAEKFLLAIFELVEHSQQTLKDLTAALNNNEINSALVHLYKFFPSCNECALVGSEAAFKTLENLFKQGKLESLQYSPPLDIIAAHLTELRAATDANLMQQI